MIADDLAKLDSHELAHCSTKKIFGTQNIDQVQ